MKAIYEKTKHGMPYTNSEPPMPPCKQPKQEYASSEGDEQEALFEWASIKTAALPELALLFHIPNGEYRDKGTAAKLKRQGVKAGVPDLFLPVARGGYHGLFVELKRTNGGTVSNSQKQWIKELEKKGYAAGVCHGWLSASRVIEQYLMGQIRRGELHDE